MPGPATVLLTGFGPFGGGTANPSGDVLPLVVDAWTRPERLVTAVLPVEFGTSGDALRALLDAHRPSVVVALGLAQGRSAITPERVAVNLDDARIPDNAGGRPIDAPVVAGGPAGYFSTLPIKAIVHALRAAGVPASVSQTAGTFVCNHVFYGLMHHTAGKPTRAGFIHVPFLPEQAEERPDDPPSMALDDIILGIMTAVETAVHVERDVAQAGGATH